MDRRPGAYASRVAAEHCRWPRSPPLLPALFRIRSLFLRDEPWAALHIAVALTAYALLIVAALQALVLLDSSEAAPRLPDPAAETLPRCSRWTIPVSAGRRRYALLTLTLLSGVLFSEEVFGKPLRFSTRSCFGARLVVFGALLFGRHRYGGAVARRCHWILAGTGLLVVAYVGSKFVLEVILRR